MKFLKRTLCAAVATAAVAGSASAQGIGGLGGATGGGLGDLSGLLGGGGGGGGGTGGGFGGLGGGGGGSTTQAGSSGAGAINLTPPSSYAQAPQSVATSNNIGKFYANPFHQGRAGVLGANFIAVVNPGGFGAPIYGTTFGAAQNTTGGGGRGGAAGGFGGATGAGGGGFGGATAGNARGGGGAMGGLNAGATNQSGQVVNPGVPGISYTATIKFDTPVVTPAQFQANMQGVINRTSAVSNPAGVQVITGPNGGVILRGTARSEDEARAAENVLRLTPGVRDVQNELTFPRQ